MFSSDHCHRCGSPLSAATYRVVGIEGGTWRSIYACNAACEAAIRALHVAPQRAAAPHKAHTLPALRQAQVATQQLALTLTEALT